MASDYLSRLPVIQYAGRNVRDITRRVKILDNVLQNRFQYYVKEVEEGDRADTVAYREFGDDYLDWVVYLSNGIIDPYHDWKLGQYDFDRFVADKYGSLEKAMRLILYYRNDWTDTRVLGVSGYSALPENELKYWTLVQSGAGAGSTYRRRKVDWFMNTNHIVRYTLDGSGTGFQNNEPVSVTIAANSSGNAQVVEANATHLTVQHCHGVLADSNTYPLFANSEVIGEYSGITRGIDAVTVVSTNFPDAGNNTTFFANSEPIYWAPVTAYEHEIERNSLNGSLRILNQSVALRASGQLEDMYRRG